MEKRNTIQKELVLSAVMTMQCHATADEVYDFIRRTHPTIGKGTVYRNLGILAEEGKIRRVEFPEGPARYDHILKKHYHLQCVKCKKLFDVDMDEVEGLKTRIRDTHGMEFLDYDILFRGLCPECQEKMKEEQ